MTAPDHMGLRIGESICLEYVTHGTLISDTDEAQRIAHHSEFVVLVTREKPQEGT